MKANATTNTSVDSVSDSNRSSFCIGGFGTKGTMVAAAGILIGVVLFVLLSVHVVVSSSEHVAVRISHPNLVKSNNTYKGITPPFNYNEYDISRRIQSNRDSDENNVIPEKDDGKDVLLEDEDDATKNTNANKTKANSTNRDNEASEIWSSTIYTTCGTNYVLLICGITVLNVLL